VINLVLIFKAMDEIPQKKRLSIAIVIDVDDGKNGAVISTRRFVNLLRQEHDVSVITSGSPGPGKVLFPRFYPIGVKRIMKTMNTPLALPSTRLLRKALKGKDIVHVQFPFFLGMEAVRVARKLKIPVVTTFHIQAEHLAMNAGIHSLKFIKYCYRIWIKYFFNRSNAVICPSVFAENELRQNGLKAPSLVISNGIIPLFKMMPVEKPQEYRERFIILTVGRLAPEKMQEMIIKGVACSAHCDKIQLIIAGEGPQNEKLAEAGSILPNPPLIVALSQEELLSYYNFSDLYIHSAVVEVECMSVMEAMACGLPVLIAESPKSATSQFALSNNSLFPADDVVQLAGKIDYWIEHPGELTLMKYQYMNRARDFSIDRSLDSLTGLYRTLAGIKE